MILSLQKTLKLYRDKWQIDGRSERNVGWQRWMEVSKMRLGPGSVFGSCVHLRTMAHSFVA